jgi:polyisoprenoid-binding protein YceI
MAAPVWRIDPVHSSVEFAIEHLAISTFRARFKEVRGELQFEEATPLESSVSVTIPVKSIDAVGDRLLARLFDGEFFDAENHPDLVFRSTGVEAAGERKYRVKGELTIKRTTRPVVLEVDYVGQATSPFGGQRVASFRAKTELDRGDYDLKWNAKLDTGANYLGERVKIELFLEASRR